MKERSKAPKFLSSNRALGLVILVGVLVSGFSLWFGYTHRKTFVPIKLLDESKLEQVNDRTFVNETVELDGRAFHHCVFRSVKFMYHGNHPVSIRDSHFQQTIAITSDDAAISGMLELVTDLGFWRDDVRHGHDDKHNKWIERVFP